MSKLILVFATVAALVVAAQAASTYSTKYDNVNVDEILKNDRLYIKYFKCLAGQGQCSPDGRELKEALPDALKTDCSKCTPKQKQGTEKVIKFVLEKKPQDYATLEKIYDPTGIYKKRYQELATKKGIKI